MSRKAAAEKQPDLLGEAPAETKTKAKAEKIAGPAVSKGQVATVERKQKTKAALTVVGNNATNTLAVIADALKDPNFKPENMRLVLDMHKEMIAEQARLDFIHAFYELKKVLPQINKDGRIEIIEKGSDGKRVAGRDRVQQSTPYATYENIREVLDPILDKHGFTLWDENEPSPDGTRLHVITHLDHNGGHGRRSIFPVPAETSGSKNNVQGWGSANSYGKRYGTIGLLGIRTRAPEDRDTDGNMPKTKNKTTDDNVIDGEVIAEEPKIDQKQKDFLIEALEDAGISNKRFCEVYKIKKVDDLPAETYEAAKKHVSDYKASKGK